MKTPPDGWDRDEQGMPDDLARELTAIRGRRATDPPIDLLRAAGHDVLPEAFEAAAQRQLAGSRWSRALVEDLNDADAASLDSADMARLLERIQRDTRVADRPRFGWAVPWLAAAAVVLIVVAGTGWVLRSRWGSDGAAPVPADIVAGIAEVSVAAPAFHLPLERPDVRISLASLTWRSQGPPNPLVADLRPALDAFRAGDDAAANRDFSTLSTRYPGAVEIALYQGIARLFLNDLDGAVRSLRDAERLADPSFLGDVTWYLAVADERAGKLDGARARIATLCHDRRPADSRACAALDRWP